jgi:hypothetical protein
MARMLVGSIDLSKIDKKRVVTTDKDGNPFKNGGKYLNVVVWVNDDVDQYGNIASVQESITKEEREQGVKPTYIGNLKDLQSQSATNEPKNANVPVGQAPEDDDLPF